MARSHLRRCRVIAQKVDRVQAELDHAMRAARDSGESLRDIGQEVRLSHQQVANRIKALEQREQEQ